MNITYNCTDSLIRLCNFEGTPKSISLSVASSCTTGEVAYWCESGFCSGIIDSFYIDEYTNEVYDLTPCAGQSNWITGVELLSPDSILSCTGTITQIANADEEIVEIITVTSVDDLFQTIQLDYERDASSYHYDITINTIEGCTTHYEWMYTLELESDCSIGQPTISPLTIEVITDNPNVYEIVDGCIEIPKSLIDGIYVIQDQCVKVDCNDVLCSITDYIAGKLLCTTCKDSVDEAYSAYLKYSMIESLMNCSKCCQAGQLYNSLQNELHACSKC